MNLQEKKELYARCIPAYEIGEPIMPDSEFDALEASIMSEDSDFVRAVGSNRKGDVKHLSPMLSLGKIKTWDADDLTKTISPKDPQPIIEVMEWFDKFKPFIKQHGHIIFVIEPKFDGNAINLIYENKDLRSAARNTSDESGFDVTSKISLVAPLTVPTPKLIEVRCELLIPKDVFDLTYVKEGYANERNYVAGMMSAPTIRAARMKELVLAGIEVRIHQDGNFIYPPNSHEIIDKLGFNQQYPVKRITFELNELDKMTPEFFKKLYDEMLDYRINKCPFRLDGFVIKAQDNIRVPMGFNSHDPNWAIAIKFPPKDAFTKMLDIEFETGKTGAISPVAILEPVDLDGSIVEKASLYNWGYIVDNNLYPGSEVVLVKSGDIIPRIIKIRKASTTPIPMPTECSSCHGPVTLSESGIMFCTNPDCPAQAIAKITEGLQIMGIKGIGEATVEILYPKGFKVIHDYFNPALMNKEWIESTDTFKGRSLEKILEAMTKVKTLKLAQVIRSLSIKDVGDTVSEQLANQYSNVPFQSEGLNKSAWAKMTDKASPEYAKLLSLVKALTDAGIEVLAAEPPKDTSSSLRYEMTGEPPHDPKIGSTKAEWSEEFGSFGAVHASLTKESGFLVTDSHGSKSGKMAKAKKYGVRIMTYPEFLEHLRSL